MPKHPIHDRRHPAWCDRPRCITGDGQARHASTTTRLPTREQLFELTLVQNSPDGAPELIVEIAETELATPDGVHVVNLPEIKALAETLLIEYLKAAQLTTAAGGTGKVVRQ
ncbi:MAG: hypothetical protein LC808_26665 [Actinobacteria bacterium]|nr:hypothetical protein [Actinomycetota bacterium]